MVAVSLFYRMTWIITCYKRYWQLYNNNSIGHTTTTDKCSWSQSIITPTNRLNYHITHLSYWIQNRFSSCNFCLIKCKESNFRKRYWKHQTFARFSTAIFFLFGNRILEIYIFKNILREFFNLMKIRFVRFNSTSGNPHLRTDSQTDRQSWVHITLR